MRLATCNFELDAGPKFAHAALRIRRFFFVGVITVIFPSGSARQLFAAVIAAMTWLLFLTLSKPFKAESDDAVAVACAFSLVVLLAIAQLFHLAQLAEVQEDVMSKWQYDLLSSNSVVLSFVMGGFLLFVFFLVCGMIGGQACLSLSLLACSFELSTWSL